MGQNLNLIDKLSLDYDLLSIHIESKLKPEELIIFQHYKWLFFKEEKPVINSMHIDIREFTYDDLISSQKINITKRKTFLGFSYDDSTLSHNLLVLMQRFCSGDFERFDVGDNIYRIEKLNLFQYIHFVSEIFLSYVYVQNDKINLPTNIYSQIFNISENDKLIDEFDFRFNKNRIGIFDGIWNRELKKLLENKSNLHLLNQSIIDIRKTQISLLTNDLSNSDSVYYIYTHPWLEEIGVNDFKLDLKWFLLLEIGILRNELKRYSINYNTKIKIKKNETFYEILNCYLQDLTEEILDNKWFDEWQNNINSNIPNAFLKLLSDDDKKGRKFDLITIFYFFHRTGIISTYNEDDFYKALSYRFYYLSKGFSERNIDIYIKNNLIKKDNNPKSFEIEGNPKINMLFKKYG